MRPHNDLPMVNIKGIGDPKNDAPCSTMSDLGTENHHSRSKRWWNLEEPSWNEWNDGFSTAVRDSFLLFSQYTSQWWRIERHAIQWQRVSEGQFDGLQDQSGLGLFFRWMRVGWRVSHEFPIKTFKIHGNKVRWGLRMMIPITDSVDVLRSVSGQQSIDGVFVGLSLVWYGPYIDNRYRYTHTHTHAYIYIWYIRYIYTWAFITGSKPLTVGLGSPHWGSNSFVRQAWADHSVEPGRAIGAAR